jgi:hypothetical protein
MVWTMLFSRIVEPPRRFSTEMASTAIGIDGADGQAGAQAQVDGGGPEQQAEEHPDDDRLERELGRRLAGRHVGWKAGAAGASDEAGADTWWAMGPILEKAQAEPGQSYNSAVNGRPAERADGESVSELTTARLSVYLRSLEASRRPASTRVVPRAGRAVPAQRRSDPQGPGHFGEFGVRGVGYYVKDLRRHLREILGLDRQLKVVILGAGNLGLALADYPGFRHDGFDVVALLDTARDKVGQYSRAGSRSATPASSSGWPSASGSTSRCWRCRPNRRRRSSTPWSAPA